MMDFQELSVGDNVFRVGDGGELTKLQVAKKCKLHLVLVNGEKYNYGGRIVPATSGREFLLLPRPEVEEEYKKEQLKKYRTYISKKVLDPEALNDGQILMLSKIVVSLLS